MRTIRLYGELGKLFGEKYELAVSSAGEAVRALCTILDGFEKYLLESEKNNVGFKVFDSENLLSEKDLSLRGTGEIKIVPVIGGANGEFRVLVGATLIAASLVMTATGVGAGAAPYVMNAGIALVVGGAIEMIVGKPKVPQPNENPDSRPSYVFNGPVNTTAQGQPVPIGYGRLRVGSAVISAALTTKDIMAGYHRVAVEKSQDVTALGSPENFGWFPPPANSVRRELIATGTTYYNDPYRSGSTAVATQYWTYRYYYIEYHMELRPV